MSNIKPIVINRSYYYYYTSGEFANGEDLQLVIERLNEVIKDLTKLQYEK